MKGISALVATLLMLALTVALGGIAYWYLTGALLSEDDKLYCETLMKKLEGDSFIAYTNKGCWVCWNRTSDVFEIGDRKYVEGFGLADICKSYTVLE
jgi:flagellin-like protein